LLGFRSFINPWRVNLAYRGVNVESGAPGVKNPRNCVNRYCLQ
jgi:hypothetical protein